MNRIVTRAAATGGVLLLSLALSGPVSAHEHPGSATKGSHADHRHGDHTVTLADMQSWVNRAVDSRLRDLDRLADRVATSDRLSAEQKSAWNARIDARRMKLGELKSQVAAADTKHEVFAALRDAKFLRGCGGWKHFHHDDRSSADKN